MIGGIDGGGTSTKLELRDENNGNPQRMKFGPFNISAIGPEGVKRVMEEIAEKVDVSLLTRFCVGGAGASFAGLKELLLESLIPHGFCGQLRIYNDSEIALRGAMEGPGGILIAGTGSIAFGKNEKGEAVRVGGWGHLIDDEGSGYTIGRDALRVAVRAEDGRAEACALRAAVLDAVQAQDNRGILNYVYYSGRDKSAVAALASCVLALAEKGDSAALGILNRNADELKTTVCALGARLGIVSPKIALLGGLLESDNPYSRVVREKLQTVCIPIAPEHDALWGAAQLAWEMN